MISIETKDLIPKLDPSKKLFAAKALPDAEFMPSLPDVVASTIALVVVSIA